MTPRRGRAPAAARRVLAGSLCLAVMVVASLVSATSAGAEVPSTFPDQTAPQVSIPSIIPLPNTGVAPKSSTDLGGWAQYAVLGGIVVALSVIVLLIVRESRQKRAAAAAEQVDN